jgi:manganese transport protein
MQIKKILHSLGPGIITAALVFGPSKITLTSKLGADYGYSMIWIIVVAIFFMSAFTSMSARVGIATDRSLLQTVSHKWGRGTAVFLGVGIFLVTASFQAGNSIGVGIAVAEATHTSPKIWIVVGNVIGIGLLFFGGFYKLLEKVMIILIGLMLLAFITTLFFARPDKLGIVKGLIPTVAPGSSLLIIGFIASCFSIVGAFYQAYLVQERKRSNPGIILNRHASVPGILILGVLSAIVLICAGSVLYPRNIHINTATDMARALEPLFGRYAAALFLTGLFGASFSALIGNATVGGTILGDALKVGNGLSSARVKYLIALVMIIGAAIALQFGSVPLQLIVFAQSVTIFLVPFIGLALFFIANDRHIMGDFSNNFSDRVIGIAGLLLIIGLGVLNLRNMFFS